MSLEVNGLLPWDRDDPVNVGVLADAHLVVPTSCTQALASLATLYPKS